jgi:hypothetical protein
VAASKQRHRQYENEMKHQNIEEKQNIGMSKRHALKRHRSYRRRKWRKKMSENRSGGNNGVVASGDEENGENRVCLKAVNLRRRGGMRRYQRLSARSACQAITSKAA